jgi:hypothetical protein
VLLGFPFLGIGEELGVETDELDFAEDSDAFGEWAGDGVLL